MAVDTSMFAQVIQDHLDLKRRNAALEHEMPLEKYLTDDPFENHPLFKTEEQARFEDTMDGVQGIEAEETSLDWPTTDDTFVEAPTVEAAEVAPAEADGPRRPLRREPLVALPRLRLGRLETGGAPPVLPRWPPLRHVASRAKRARAKPALADTRCAVSTRLSQSPMSSDSRLT